TATGSGASVSYTWDGKNGSGVLQPEGPYTLELLVTDDTASTSGSIGTTLDNTFPVSTITSPTQNQVLSNVYQSGDTGVPVIGTATDLNLNNWTLSYGSGANPSSWTTITTGTTAVNGATFGTWATASLLNGTYTLRLQVWDKAGNLTTTTVSTVMVE